MLLLKATIVICQRVDTFLGVLTRGERELLLNFWEQEWQIPKLPTNLQMWWKNTDMFKYFMKKPQLFLFKIKSTQWPTHQPEELKKVWVELHCIYAVYRSILMIWDKLIGWSHQCVFLYKRACVTFTTRQNSAKWILWSTSLVNSQQSAPHSSWSCY